MSLHVFLTAELPPGAPEVLLEDGEEDHEFLFTDGFMVLTRYEGCYATWSVRDGSCLGGSLWAPGSRVLSPASLRVVRRHAEGALSVVRATAGSECVQAQEAVARLEGIAKKKPHQVAELVRARGRHATATANLARATADEAAIRALQATQ